MKAKRLSDQRETAAKLHEANAYEAEDEAGAEEANDGADNAAQYRAEDAAEDGAAKDPAAAAADTSADYTAEDADNEVAAAVFEDAADK